MSGEKKISEQDVDDYINKFEEQMDAGELDDLGEEGDEADEEIGEFSVDADYHTISSYMTEETKDESLDTKDENVSQDLKDKNVFSADDELPLKVVNEIIESMIHEYIIKSLEEIAIVETDDTEFIHDLINDLILIGLSVKESDVQSIAEEEEKHEEIIDRKESELEQSELGTVDELKESTEGTGEAIRIETDVEAEEITDEELAKNVVRGVISDIFKKVVQETLDSVIETDKLEKKEMPAEKIKDELEQRSGLTEIHCTSSSSNLTDVTLPLSPHSLGSVGDETSRAQGAAVETTAPPPAPVDPDVLEPDNPLMVRFQIALKAHLKKQKDRLSEEIHGLKCEIKENNKEEETVSQGIYQVEVILNQQQQRLNKLSKDVKEVTSNWDNVMNMVTNLKVNFNVKYEQLEAVTKKDSELQTELESLAALVQQFSEWQQKQESEITTTKLLSERQMSDKKKLFTEKQKLDMLILAVRKDVLKCTRTFSDMKAHIKNKTDELNIVEQTVADANADIEEMLYNNRKIMQSWGKNIIIISQRNKTLNDIKISAEDHRLKFSSLEAEVEGAKKECIELIKSNEQLTARVKYLERLHDNLKRRLKEEIEKKRALEENLSQITRMRDCTEVDLRKSLKDTLDIRKKTLAVMDEVGKLKTENNITEQKIVDKLIEQDIKTKSARSRSDKITKLKNSIREQEIAIADYENKIAKLMVEIEKQRMICECSELQLKDVDNQIIDKESKIKKLEAELERTIFRGQQTQGEINLSVHKLEKLKEAKGECELSPEEIKIRELEKNISDLDEESSNLQQFWLRQENHIVAISQHRTEQLQKISVLRKQLIILDKKNMTIEYNIQVQEKERKDYISMRESLQKKLIKLNEQVYKKKGYREMLDNDNLHIQNQYLNDLKDAEDASISLQNEINEIDKQKNEYYNKIGEMQKEVLAWEKKLQMAVETRQLLENLNSEGGEVANMKNEIHRMEIRYSQLRKAQEKLTHDMEMCVSRRDGIVETALARERRHVKGTVHYTRQQFTKKIDELKNGLRQTINEINTTSKEYNSKEEKKKQLEQQLQLKNEQLHGLQKATEEMDLQLAEGHLHRQKNLEVLVRLQRKCKYYREIKESQYKLLFRNESALELETQKQKKINSDLMSVIESLIDDFPSLQMPFSGIRNTLRIASI